MHCVRRIRPCKESSKVINYLLDPFIHRVSPFQFYSLFLAVQEVRNLREAIMRTGMERLLTACPFIDLETAPVK